MKKQFFSGNSLEQALLAAARQFDIDPERVAYSVREKKHGFVKMRRRVVIEVDPDAPELPPGEAHDLPATVPTRKVPDLPPPGHSHEDRGEEKRPPEGRSPAERPPAERPPAQRRPTDEPRRGSEPRPPREEDPRFEQTPMSESASVERAVREVLRFLDLEAEVAVQRRPDIFEVEISHTDRDLLVGREGKVLQAMEYLVPRMVRSWIGQGVPVKVDCEGFRAEREEELRELAERAAEEVARSGRSQLLEPMSPGDRRQVHMALAEDSDVETESEGSGYYKRVRISPVDGADEGDDDEYDDEYGDDDGDDGDDDDDDDDEYDDDDDKYDDDEYDDDEYDDGEYDEDEDEEYDDGEDDEDEDEDDERSVG